MEESRRKIGRSGERQGNGNGAEDIAREGRGDEVVWGSGGWLDALWEKEGIERVERGTERE